MADYDYPHTAVPHEGDSGGGSGPVALTEDPAGSGLYIPIAATTESPAGSGLFTTGS